MRYRCPTCGKKLEPDPGKSIKDSHFFPFCSSRCRLIDLGAWFEEDYKIPSKPQPGENIIFPSDQD